MSNNSFNEFADFEWGHTVGEPLRYIITYKQKPRQTRNYGVSCKYISFLRLWSDPTPAGHLELSITQQKTEEATCHVVDRANVRHLCCATDVQNLL